MYVPRGGGAPPQWDRTVPWCIGRRVVDKVPCALRFGAPPLEGESKEGGREVEEGGAGSIITRRGGGLLPLSTGGGSC